MFDASLPLKWCSGLRDSPDCRVARLGAGIAMLGLAFAMAYASNSIECTMAEVSTIWTCLWDVLLMAVLAGCWATARGATYTLGLGGLVSLYVLYMLYCATPADERVSFIWAGVPCWIVATMAFSLHNSRTKARLDGLTWSTAKVP